MMNRTRFPFFTNTYTAFSKYVSRFNLDKTMVNGKLSYSYVNAQLAEIFTYGKIFSSKDYSPKDGQPWRHRTCSLETVLYNGLFFTFVCTDEVIILTDLCDPVEWQSENVLLGAQYGVLQDSPFYGHYTHYANNKDYTVISTYNAFYGFSDASSHSPNIDLNELMFNAFTTELSSKLPFSESLEDSGLYYYPFKFVCLEDVIILYDYVSDSLPEAPFLPAVSYVPDKDINEADTYSEEDTDVIYITIDVLADWGAFTDEGIFPSWWD